MEVQHGNANAAMDQDTEFAAFSVDFYGVHPRYRVNRRVNKHVHTYTKHSLGYKR